ncbi:MAG: hypothetical protein D6798_13810, partial [Deltaproteobacteria bacterium]
TSGCAFVASRNSRLYHPAGCPVIDRIFPANRICYPSAAAAEATGRTRSQACPDPAPPVAEPVSRVGG